MQEFYNMLVKKYDAAPWYTSWLWGLALLVVIILGVFILTNFVKERRHEEKKKKLVEKADKVITENKVTTAVVEEHLDAHAKETAELEKKKETYKRESKEREATIDEIKAAATFDDLDKLKDQL